MQIPHTNTDALLRLRKDLMTKDLSEPHRVSAEQGSERSFPWGHREPGAAVAWSVQRIAYVSRWRLTTASEWPTIQDRSHIESSLFAPCI